MKIAITIGDPAGISSEIILKALNSLKITEDFEPFIIGSKDVMRKASQRFELPLLQSEILEACTFDADNLQWGKLSRATGELAAKSLILAAEMAMRGEVDAIVTAPLNKEAIQLAGYHYPGHTEFLAEVTNTKDFAMMLAGGNLKVVLVTTHLALRDVSKNLTTEKILSKIKVANDSLKNFWGIDKPKIAVCALNPHGGEHGLFGDEEQSIITPAINIARDLGINAMGPFPSDTLFVQAKEGTYDAVICMYHDQALIPLKMVSFGRGVNITIGLPIIRTSVDHGTAFDIAGKGIASEESMIEAINIACKLAKIRNRARCHIPL